MKNKKSQRLTFQKKSITELQHNATVEIEGGNYIEQAANAAIAIKKLRDQARYTQE